MEFILGLRSSAATEQNKWLTAYRIGPSDSLKKTESLSTDCRSFIGEGLFISRLSWKEIIEHIPGFCRFLMVSNGV